MSKPVSGPITDIGELARTYSVVREIGRGGMGAVVLARHREAQHYVAIKIAFGDKLGPEAMARFAREAQLMARLRHPNIVGLYTIEPIGHGRVGIVMEYVRGQSLARILARRERLPLEECVRIVRDLAKALAHAHALGVIHRDVKPQNVLIEDATGMAKLADFGIAKAIGEASEMTATGAALGTPAYMSPEQIDGERLDARSDIYSLGLLAWELVSGRRPWAGEPLFRLLYKQKHERLPAITDFRADAPMGLQLALEGALAKEPDARWESVGAMLAQLEEEQATAAMLARRQRAAALHRPEKGRATAEGATVPMPRGRRTEAGEREELARNVGTDQSADTVAMGDRAIVRSIDAPDETSDRVPAASRRRESWIPFSAGLLLGGLATAAIFWGVGRTPGSPGTSPTLSSSQSSAPMQAASSIMPNAVPGVAATSARDDVPRDPASTGAPAAARSSPTSGLPLLASSDTLTNPAIADARTTADGANAGDRNAALPSDPTMEEPRAESLGRLVPATVTTAAVSTGRSVSIDSQQWRAEALALATRARQLVASRVADSLASRLVDSALVLDPGSGAAFLVRARLQVARGRVRDAWTDIELGARTGEEWEALALATALRVRESGRTMASHALAPKVKEALTPRRRLDAARAAWLAAALAQTGDSSTALTMIEQADTSDSQLDALLSDPLLATLRGSARFQEVVRRAAR